MAFAPVFGRVFPATFDRRAAVASNGLLNNLVAYWALDEAAGANDALDAHSNGLTMTQVSSPGSASGVVYASARTFDGSADYFTRPYEAATNVGSGDFTLAAWFYLSNATGNRSIVDHRGNVPGAGAYGFRGYLLAPQNTSNAIRFFVDYEVEGGYPVLVDSAGVTSSAWHLAIAWRASNTIYISIDNATAVSAACTGNFDCGGPFVVGYKSTTFTTSITYLDGRVGPLALWKSATGAGGALTAAQRTALYNGGAGLAYTQFTT